MDKLLVIRDDCGMLWTFDKENSRVVLVCDMKNIESGYRANSWEECVKVLNEYGYISCYNVEI